MAPVELHALVKRLEVRDRKRMYPAALICSVVANVNCDREKRPEGYSPADFLPDLKSSRSPVGDLPTREWVEAWERGEFREPVSGAEKAEIQNLTQRLTQYTEPMRVRGVRLEKR